MADNTGTTGNAEGAASLVYPILLQNWANMVADARARTATVQADLTVAERQVEILDARATRLYQDNIELSAMLNDFTEADAQKDQLIMRLTDLVISMVRENPNLRAEYRDEFFAAIAGFTPENPIDLTAEEELDEDL